MKQTNEKAIKALLEKSGFRFSSLSDIPLKTVRHVQRGAFPDMRMIELTRIQCEKFLQQPILQDLLCTRIGYQGPSPAHYIPRPDGSRDQILIFCTNGRGWLELDGKEWPVNRHDVFLIPRGKPHVYGADPDMPWSNYWVHFRGRQSPVFADLIGRAKSPVVHLHRHEEIVASFEQLYHRMSNAHTVPELIAASGTLSQLLCMIQLRMGSAELKNQNAEAAIERSLDFMHRNLEKKLRLRDLARVAGISPGHYGMLFHKKHRQTPIDYFNRLKIQKAGELLKSTNSPINTIGESLGFLDPYYFSRLFKKVIGISPRAYRGTAVTTRYSATDRCVRSENV